MQIILNERLYADYGLPDPDWICYGWLFVYHGDTNQPHPHRLLWNDQQYSGVFLPGNILHNTCRTPYHVSFELFMQNKTMVAGINKAVAE